MTYRRKLIVVDLPLEGINEGRGRGASKMLAGPVSPGSANEFGGQWWKPV
jgi:hypothetical protein